MSSVVETVTDLVTPILDGYHFELVDVEFEKKVKVGTCACSLISPKESQLMNVQWSVIN